MQDCLLRYENTEMRNDFSLELNCKLSDCKASQPGMFMLLYRCAAALSTLDFLYPVSIH